MEQVYIAVCGGTDQPMTKADFFTAMLMLSAVSDNALRPAAVGDRDAVRASVFKQLLLVEMGRNG